MKNTDRIELPEIDEAGLDPDDWEGLRDLGPQLTRALRTGKVWLSLLAHGTDRYARLFE